MEKKYKVHEADKYLPQFIQQYEKEQDSIKFDVDNFFKFSDEAKMVVITKFGDKIPTEIKKVFWDKLGKEKFHFLVDGMKKIHKKLNIFYSNSSKLVKTIFNQLNCQIEKEQIYEEIDKFVRQQFFTELLALFPNKMSLNSALSSLEKKAIIFNEQVNNSNNKSKGILAECLEDLFVRPKRTEYEVKQVVYKLRDYIFKHCINQMSEFSNCSIIQKKEIAEIFACGFLEFYSREMFKMIREQRNKEDVNSNNTLEFNNKAKIVPQFDLSSKKSTSTINFDAPTLKDNKENIGENKKCILM